MGLFYVGENIIFLERSVFILSRLVKIELRNFMSLPNAVLEFDETGIISPVGYNDSGKSAITRAMEVLWFDAYPTMQAKFITDGEEYFSISNYFDDDVVITRSKYATGGSHWVMQRGDMVVYDNQLANGAFASSKGVPEAIAKYLGVVKDDATGEILNIRRNTNKLMLIATTGGENYKILNNLCQGERLAFASAKLNEDVNKSNRELTSKQSKLTGKKESLNQMHVFDEETEVALLSSSQTLGQSAGRLSSLIAICDKFEGFAGKRVIPEIPAVDTSRLEDISRVDEVHKKSIGHVIPEIPLVDVARLSSLGTILSAYKASQGTVIPQIPVVDVPRLEAVMKLKTVSDSCHGSVIPTIPVVDVTRLSKIQALARSCIAVNAAVSDIEAKKSEYSAKRAELNRVAEENKWQICKNCGEVVTFGSHNHEEGTI